MTVQNKGVIFMENYVTWKEILQQPLVWEKELKFFKENFEEIRKILEKFNKKETRFIFTGAGSSEYVGNSICSYLKSYSKLDILSIPTTDIVTNPAEYLEEDIPTILISCARSGNSPESVAAVKLADKLIKNIQHIFLTCNPNGDLAKLSKESENKFAIIMPEGTNDKGFAMTSSFSSMLLGGILLFTLGEKTTNDIENLIKILGNNSEKLIEFSKRIAEIENIERIVYLGNYSLKGLAEEMALKVLELTSGKIVAFHNSFLGFRHGPKSLVDKNTMIICLLSDNDYTRKYELDLIKEIKNDGITKNIVILDTLKSDEFFMEKYYFTLNTSYNFLPFFQGLIYLYFAQLLALYKSINLGINPDNPCPSGEVNRVVKGVIIHNF